ncbi:MAG: tetratricopeptide repeat protein [Opitutae bacterium]|nr:tetratricopeptide repeat protein [Opitutae bacterium]
MKRNNQTFPAWLVLSFACFCLVACGGDETPAPEETGKAASNAEEKPAEEKPEEELPEPEPEPLPDPNGIYLPTGEKYPNGRETNVYANGEGFFMWFNGSIWKITDKVGGGRTVSTGEENINGKWSNSAKASHYPDKANEKDALFRLAVAYQGAQDDNPNAIRLFEQFVRDYPDDKEIPAAYLSLGDLAISEVKQDEQPTYKQISKARDSYKLVREKTQDMRLLTDATFNEGGLLERIAGNPEGLVDHYLTFDKNEDEVLQTSEFTAAKIQTDKPFSAFDLNQDRAIDYGELFELATLVCYAQMEALYREYNEKHSDSDGARVSQATEKIGFACEKQGRPSEMLKMYYEDIKKFGNDPNNVGVDGILKKYSAKYKEYDDLYGKTLDLLEKLQTPAQPVSFTYRSRKGVEETISGTVEEVLKDRKKLLPYLSSSFEGMDADISTEVAKFRTAIFVNPDYASKFRGYLKKYKALRSNFPENLSPKTAFASLLKEAVAGGERALELRMRATLDRAGSAAAGNYNPQRSDFPVASPGVLVWMAEKLIAQNSTADAVAAMERLTQVFGDTGGEFLFDAHYMLGQARQKERNFAKAADHYESALANSWGHEKANDARIRKGESLFEVGKSTKDDSALDRAYASFSEVRSDSDTPLEERAQSSYMMGECKKALKQYPDAAFLYLETTLSFPSAVNWVPKAYDQAISCYEQTGQVGQISNVNKQYVAWQRKFLK